MGEVISRIAGRFLRGTGHNQPLTAEIALYEAGLLPCPHSGSGEAATLRGAVVFYDDERADFESEVWSVVCGVLLRREGAHDSADARERLALRLGKESDMETTGLIPVELTAALERDSA